MSVSTNKHKDSSQIIQGKENENILKKDQDKSQEQEQLSMSELYYKAQKNDEFNTNKHNQDLNNKNAKEQQSGKGHQNTEKQCKSMRSGNNDGKSRHDAFSGISFSRFQAISQPSEMDDAQNKKNQNLKISIEFPQLPKNNFSKSNINKVPTSTKVISSNKIIQDPIEVLAYQQNELGPSALKNQHKDQIKHEYTFYYNFLGESQLFQKFAKFAKSKQMDLNIGNNQIVVSKKIALYKLALKLCFPSDYEHEVYQLSCPSQRSGKIIQLSGGDRNYYNFREQFLLNLWIDKYLIIGSLHQNIRHFLQFANSQENYQKLSKLAINPQGKFVGQIDQMKILIDKAAKNASSKLKLKSNNNDQKNQQQHDEVDRIKLDQSMNEIKKRMRIFQQNLKDLLEKQMKKQEDLKQKRLVISKKKLLQKLENNEQKEQKMEGEKSNKVFVTPSVQRMLFTMLYHHFELDTIIKKYFVSQKSFGDFQKKKMIIKGSLNTLDIFKYLEIQEIYEVCKSGYSQAQLKLAKLVMFPQSVKILSSLKYSNYSYPSQILEMISIFKNTLKKQIDCSVQNSNNMKVKLQDHNNLQRTFLQLYTYCLLMCENREIYINIETARIFCDYEDEKIKLFQRQSLTTLNILKKAINFIQNQWEL